MQVRGGAKFVKMASKKFARSVSQKSRNLLRSGTIKVKAMANRVAEKVFPGRMGNSQPRRVRGGARPGRNSNRTADEVSSVQLVNGRKEIQISHTGQIIKLHDLMGLWKSFEELGPDEGTCRP